MNIDIDCRKWFFCYDLQLSVEHLHETRPTAQSRFESRARLSAGFSVPSSSVPDKEMSEPPRKKRHIEEEDGEQLIPATDSQPETPKETTNNADQPPTIRDEETATVPNSQSDQSKKPIDQAAALRNQNSSQASRRVSFAPNSQPQDALNEGASQLLQEPEERKPRLVITKMVLNNFKSYAGRQVIGPFQKVHENIIFESYNPTY